MSELELEIWVSSQNRHERHYFRRNGQHGYQDGQYIFGYNPEVITQDQVDKILAIINAVVPEGR